MPITRDPEKIKFPDDHGYLCGYGVHFEKDENNSLSMFEDGSHNCIDIKGFIDGKHIWEQFFYWDYEVDAPSFFSEDIDYPKAREICQKDAERKCIELINQMGE